MTQVTERFQRLSSNSPQVSPKRARRYSSSPLRNLMSATVLASPISSVLDSPKDLLRVARWQPFDRVKMFCEHIIINIKILPEYNEKYRDQMMPALLLADKMELIEEINKMDMQVFYFNEFMDAASGQTAGPDGPQIPKKKAAF
uniref:Uncharacterized protein n=1 Tax=Caenorhabditis japonica TaxID=281687 RepID=A0A8R1ENE1_CAEJA